MFTKATIPKLDYAHKHTNQTVDEKDFYHRYLAVVAAVSADRGVDCIMIFDEAVKQDTFIAFLEELRRRNSNRPLHLFLDNLSVHKTQEVKEAYVRLNIKVIWNVPYAYMY